MHLKKVARFFLLLTVVALCVRQSGALAELGEPASVTVNTRPAMTITQAAVLGIIEGLTEYLPVSSTGHLLLAQHLMGIGHDPAVDTERRLYAKQAADAYAICIQAGAIIAVLGLYFRRVMQIGMGLTGRDPIGRKLLVNILAGFVPAAVLGLCFNDIIKTCLFGPWPVVAAWFVGGVAILAVSRRSRGNRRTGLPGATLEAMTWRMALIIGCAQCVAMWPGVSRSLVTIVGGLLVGLSLTAAVEYSFLLGLATLGAATAYDALKHGEMLLRTFDALPIAVGLLFAFVSAVISVKWMVAYLNRHGLAVFGYYRVALALATALWLTTAASG